MAPAALSSVTMHPTEPSPDEPAAIQDRTDTGSGFWNVGWPLLALALIVVMTLHACLQP